MFLAGCADNSQLNSGSGEVEIWLEAFTQEMQRLMARRPLQAESIERWMNSVGIQWFNKIASGKSGL